MVLCEHIIIHIYATKVSYDDRSYYQNFDSNSATSTEVVNTNVKISF